MEIITVVLMLLLLALPSFYLFKWTEKRAKISKYVNALPGPKAFPLIGTVYEMFGLPREELFKTLASYAKLYQPIFRTWALLSPEIHLMQPEHMEMIMSSSTHINKAGFYSFLHQWLGLGLLTSTGSRWHSHRKLITPTFHFKILESFTEIFAEKSDILVKKLKKEANGKVFDMCPYVTLCALDIICETAMGAAINAQDERESEYISAIYETSEVTFARIIKPWLRPNFIYNISSEGKAFKKNLKVLHGFTKQIIQERKRSFMNKKTSDSQNQNDDMGMKKRMAFLDLLLETSDNGKLLSDEDIREEVDTFMFEGHDTTAAGIGWVLSVLGSYPDIQEKVFQELDEIFHGSDRHPTIKDLQEMKYLERVIKETLRLYPSVPFIGRELIEDVKIGDYKIPAGCTLFLHIHQTHRLEKHWPNPDQFNPDNFLPEKVQARHPYAYLPFSAGPRNCIGQKFAMFEEKTVLSSVLRNYKVTSMENVEDIKTYGELILRPINGLQMKIELRH